MMLIIARKNLANKSKSLFNFALSNEFENYMLYLTYMSGLSHI